MERDPAGEDFAQHIGHVIHFERIPQRRMAHASPGAVGHLRVLHVVTCFRKQGMIARMIEMHMRDDNIFDVVGVDSDQPQSLSDRPQQGAIPFRGPGRIEAGIEYEATFIANDGPNEIIEWHWAIVRVTADEIMGGGPVMMPVTDREKFVRLAHNSDSFVCWRPTLQPRLRSSRTSGACRS